MHQKHGVDRPGMKTLQTTENTETCKYTIESYVYLLHKYFVTSLNKYTFFLHVVMFYKTSFVLNNDKPQLRFQSLYKKPTA